MEESEGDEALSVNDKPVGRPLALDSYEQNVH